MSRCLAGVASAEPAPNELQFTKKVPASRSQSYPFDYTLLDSHNMAATDLRSNKRKSADATTTAVKKVKTAPSADKPAPAKSALKKSKVETATATKKSDGKTTKTAIKATKKGDKPAKVSAVKAVSPASDDENDDDAEAAANHELTAAQTADLLAGFSSSEDEEASDAEGEGIAIAKLPNAPTTGMIQKHIAKSSKKNEDDPSEKPGTIHLSRLPHGFFEPQMRAYFSQFGTLTHLRLARNRKTGKSKHFAFLEFESAEVADIVAKTMDKYLMFGHILQAKRVPDEQITEDFWKGEGKKRVVPRNRLEGTRLRKGMGREAWEKRVERENQKRVEKAEKLKELGYEFDMPAVKGVESVKEQRALPVPADEVEMKRAIEDAPPVEAAEEDAPEDVTEDPGKVTVTEEKTKKRPAGGASKTKSTKSKKVKRG